MLARGKVKTEWSKEFAYVIGLIATDGCLSKNQRHIIFTSKDLQLVKLFKTYLKLSVLIGKKSRAAGLDKKYYMVQFGDVIFYKFLNSIGITQNKSKTINKIKIPKKYYFDFLRGCLDGDGSIVVYAHPESSHPQLRVRLYSASKQFLEWISSELRAYKIKGFLTMTRSVHTLAFATGASTKLLNLVYYADHPKSLSRKYKIAKRYADVV